MTIKLKEAKLLNGAALMSLHDEVKPSGYNAKEADQGLKDSHPWTDAHLQALSRLEHAFKLAFEPEKQPIGVHPPSGLPAYYRYLERFTPTGLLRSWAIDVKRDNQVIFHREVIEHPAAKWLPGVLQLPTDENTTGIVVDDVNKLEDMWEWLFDGIDSGGATNALFANVVKEQAIADADPIQRAKDSWAIHRSLKLSDLTLEQFAQTDFLQWTTLDECCSPEAHSCPQ